MRDEEIRVFAVWIYVVAADRETAEKMPQLWESEMEREEEGEK